MVPSSYPRFYMVHRERLGGELLAAVDAPVVVAREERRSGEGIRLSHRAGAP
jgi:hypothetical protein